MSIELKTPAADLIYTFQWADAIPPGVNLVSVEHTVPTVDGLIRNGQQADILGQLSTVSVGGGVNGGIYVINALAQLDSGEEVPASFTLRVFA